jgi:hypothetical protein
MSFLRWRHFAPSTLIASVIFSAVVVIPLLPAAKLRPQFFGLDVRLAASVSTTAQLYYDIGNGYRESDSVRVALVGAAPAQAYRFPLPAGRIVGLRFDPLDRAGTLVIEGPLRVATARGRVIANIPPVEIHAAHEIATIRTLANRLEVETSRTATDPQLLIALPSPLSIGLRPGEYLDGFLPRAGAVFIALLLLLFAVDRQPRLRAWLAVAFRWPQDRPGASIAVLAALAVVASAYPVVFLGASYVSPNYGTALLYHDYPTLPGYSSTVSTPENGSDMGATMYQHVPYSMIERYALRHGELPWWNRFASTGTPLMAQGQSMVGDPLNFLVVLCEGAAWAWDLKYLVCKWLFSVGLGLLALSVARDGVAVASARSGGSIGATYAALLVTFAAPFIGFFVFRINHPAIFSLCYSPWVLYSWLRLSAASGRRSCSLWLLALFATNFVLFNSGTAKEALLLLLQMNVAGAGVLLASRRPWRERGAKLVGAAWTGGLLLLVCAPIWLPFLHTVAHSFTISYTHPLVFQIQPSLALGAFDELFFRPLSRGEIVFNPALNFLLLLGLLYFLSTLRLQFRNRSAVALLVCSAPAVLIVFGIISPLWISRVPLLGGVAHVENCFLCGLIIVWSTLAGVGFAAASERLRTRDGPADLVIAGTLLCCLVGAWIGFWHASHRMVYGPGTTFTVVPAGEVLPVSPFVWGSLIALVLASAVFGLVARRMLFTGRTTPPGVILAALCLLIFLWRQGLHSHAFGFQSYVFQPQVRANFHAPSPAIEFVRQSQPQAPSRVVGLLNNLVPVWNAVYGLESIAGPDGLQNPYVRELIDASALTWSGWRLLLFPEDAAKALHFLDALNVRYYMDGRNNRGQAHPGLKLVHSSDLDVYESRSAWPRAFFTDKVSAYASPDELVHKLLTGDGQPFAAMQRSDPDFPAAAEIAREGPAHVVNPATTYTLTANRTSFTVHANGPGVIVLTEAFWPADFRVQVNGRSARLVRVNHAFKGILVDRPGNFVVAFEYVPNRFGLIMGLAAAGVGLAVTSFFWGFRRASGGDLPPIQGDLSSPERLSSDSRL